MLDERIRRARYLLGQPPWDDLRETRVLGRILEATEHGQASARRVRLLSAVAFALVAAAGAVWLTWPEQVMPVAAVTARQAPAEPPAVERDPGSVLSFADGSRAELGGGATVVAEEQSPERVRLRQRTGLVRYDVTHDSERVFTVRVGQVEVRVLGTVFSVEVTDDGVRVEVHQGKVEVRDQQRLVELMSGEQLLVFPDEQAKESEAELPAHRSHGPGVAALMARADRARQRGKLGEAARALHQLIEHHDDDPRAISAWFTLGRVEGARRRFEAAARAFEACRKNSPGGSLAEDALAESARSWQAAGRVARARAAARRYLRIYEGGTHAQRMRRLLRRAAPRARDRVGGGR